MAKDAIAYLNNYYSYSYFGDYDNIRIWARVNQTPEYILKKFPDGHWKFSRYTGAFTGSSDICVYDVEVN